MMILDKICSWVMRAEHLWRICALALVVTTSPVDAQVPGYIPACSDFNVLRFSPDELQHCIDAIKLEIVTDEARIQLLETTVCSLALELSEVKPDARGLAEAACPKKAARKKNQNKH